MKDDKVSVTIRILMKNVNLLMVIFISFFLSITTYKIVEARGAKTFLSQIQMLPMEPWKVPLFSITVYILLILVMWMGSNLIENEIYFFVMVICKLLLCFVIMYCLNMNYNGFILLVIAEMMTFSRKSKFDIFCLGVLFAIYIFTDFELLSNQISAISFKTYLQYYNNGTRSVLSAVKILLNSANYLLFISYMIITIRVQVIENKRIRQLNSQLDSTNEMLQEANKQLEEYAKTAEKITETRERNRLAREIHDTLGHVLTGVVAGIDACSTLVDLSTEETKKQLNIIGNVARKGIKDVRRSVSALRPDALERLSMVDAINQIVEEMKEITNVEINIDNQEPLLVPSEDEAEAVYRIVQESITNAIRHGKSTVINIEIRRQYNMLSIMIKDNGCGCDEIKPGFGLIHMKERLELLNGTLEFSGEDGFAVIASIPIRWGNSYD